MRSPSLIPHSIQKTYFSLENIECYVLHYQNYKLYLKQGLKIQSIHRILQFTQKSFLKPYIDHKTILRIAAYSENAWRMFGKRRIYYSAVAVNKLKNRLHNSILRNEQFLNRLLKQYT